MVRDELRSPIKHHLVLLRVDPEGRYHLRLLHYHSIFRGAVDMFIALINHAPIVSRQHGSIIPEKPNFGPHFRAALEGCKSERAVSALVTFKPETFRQGHLFRGAVEAIAIRQGSGHGFGLIAFFVIGPALCSRLPS
jgi:hypothetical protein